MAKDKGLKLFGVRIEAPPIEVEEEAVEEGMRKSYSMVNLASCEAHQSEDKGSRDHGYVSDGGLLKNSKRKRGVPWTEEEHKTFLSGLKTLGKGDWRGISRNYVTTRTPTQVASHAQKYFLRQTNPNKKKRRSSLFDVAINDNATPNHKETPIELFSKTVDAVESRDNHLVCAPSVAREAEASQSLTLATINFDATSLDFYSKPATPSIEHSDLELSIAPPRPHRIGAISVT